MTSSRSWKPWGRATRRFAMQGWSPLLGKIWLSTERRKMMRNSTQTAECVDTQFVATNVWPILTNQEKALMRSQTGPLSSLPFTVPVCSSFDACTFPSPSRQCRCGRPLDACGHHRSACAVAGVLGRRAARWRLQLLRSVEKQVLVCDSTPW